MAKMDKGWMSKSRLSKEYEDGINSLLNFAIENGKDPNAMCCPCVKCGNLRKNDVKTIKAHLIYNGVDLLYTRWIHHGEIIRSHIDDGDKRMNVDHEFYSHDPTNMVHDANIEVDRALLWKQARANKDGEFEGDMMVETAAKIDENIQQKSASTLSSTYIIDILSQVIGKPKSFGRIKGVGRYITPSIYRNICSDNVKAQELAIMKQELAAMKEQMDQMMRWREKMINRRALQEEKGSCSAKNDVVSLENGEVEVISKKFNKGESPKKSMKLKDPDIPPLLRLLHLIAKHKLGDDGSIRVSVHDDVFGENDKSIFILFDDIHNFCELQPIGVGCISVYILYLYKVCLNKNLLDKVRFVDPYAISLKIDSIEKANLVSRSLIATSPNQLVFVPCNVGFHWILLVVDAHGDKVYVMDPLHNPLHFAEWRKIMEMAMKIFRTSIGKRGRIHFDWEVIKCPQQPNGSQCGYYIMRYMKDIIEGIPDSIQFTDMFNQEMYLRREINEVRTEWCEFLQTYIDID